MSLINGMLRDLEARRSDGPGSAVFAEQIRAVPVQADGQRMRWALLSGAVLALALAGWIYLRPPTPLAVAPAAVPPAAVKAAAAVPVSVPVKIAAADKPVIAAPASAVPVPAAIPVPVPVARAVPLPVVAQAAAVAVKPVAATPVAAVDAQSIKTPQNAVAPIQSTSQPASQPGEIAVAKPSPPPLQIKRLVPAEESNAAGIAMSAARMQLEKGELRSAIEILERGLPEAVERADYHAFLAALLQRDEQHKRAIEHYLLALQKSPQTGVWWLGLAISRQALQQINEAQDAYRRARASNTLTPELTAFVEARLAQLPR